MVALLVSLMPGLGMLGIAAASLVGLGFGLINGPLIALCAGCRPSSSRWVR